MKKITTVFYLSAWIFFAVLIDAIYFWIWQYGEDFDFGWWNALLIGNGLILLPSLILFIISLTLIGAAWSRLRAADGLGTDYSRLVGMFIPIFNYGWIFVAVWGLAMDYNELLERRAWSLRRLNSSVFFAFCLAAVLGSVLKYFLIWRDYPDVTETSQGAIWLISTIIFITGAIVITEIGQGINRLPLPKSNYASLPFSPATSRQSIDTSVLGRDNNCMQCGAIIKFSDALFCWNCGTGLGALKILSQTEFCGVMAEQDGRYVDDQLNQDISSHESMPPPIARNQMHCEKEGAKDKPDLTVKQEELSYLPEMPDFSENDETLAWHSPNAASELTGGGSISLEWDTTKISDASSRNITANEALLTLKQCSNSDCALFSPINARTCIHCGTIF